MNNNPNIDDEEVIPIHESYSPQPSPIPQNPPSYEESDDYAPFDIDFEET
jgi:hypothetical protein